MIAHPPDRRLYLFFPVVIMIAHLTLVSGFGAIFSPVASGTVLSLPHKCGVPGYFNFFSHPTKRVPQFNSIELPPPPAGSYLLGGAELKGKRIRPKLDPARAIRRHPICRDPTCVAGARSPKPLQNRAHFAPPTARLPPDACLDPPREF
jgi:hypothetical protein